MSTTSRILIAYLVLLAGALLLLERQLTKRVQRQYLEAVEEPMVDMAELFAALIEQQTPPGQPLDVATVRKTWAAARARRFSAQIYNVTKKTVTAQLYVTDQNGIVLFDSDSGKAEGADYHNRRDVAHTLAGRYGARATRSDAARADSSTIFVAAPITQAGRIIGVASVSKPVSSVLPFRDQTRAWMRNLGWAFLAVITAGAYFIVTHFSRPVRRLTAYAQAVTRGERPRPPSDGAGEVTTLARAFDEMRDALDGRKYIETYVQSLTHEMKSPISAIRSACELLRENLPEGRRERFLGNIAAESDRLQKIIDRLLDLSAIETRKALEQLEEVPLMELAQDVGNQLRFTAEPRGVRMHFEREAEVTVTGESFLLEIAVANLLQNAINFSPVGGHVHVSLAFAADETWVELRVEDEGSGIPSYALPRVFERFYSLSHPSTGRKSSGLGLCFVREAVELHGGSVSVANRPQSEGVLATIRLPLGKRAFRSPLRQAAAVV